MASGREGVWSEDVRRFAQWHYLHVLSRQHPDVLATLARIDPTDDVQFSSWSKHWGLQSDGWTRAAAMATHEGWNNLSGTRSRYWFDWQETGAFVDDLLAVGSRPLQNAEHFDWLVAFQTGASPADIRGKLRKAKPGVIPPHVTTLREAIRSLAECLRLTLRPPRRGPARKPR
jgi:hypothetical protein